MKRELTTSKKELIFGKDDVIIQKLIADIPGGRTIDFTDWADDKITAGTVIINKDGNYRPHPIEKGTDENPDTYGTLTSGYSIVGVLYRTITKTNPQGSIMIDGVVNENAVAYAYTAAQKNALSNIKFISDEEA